MKLLDIPFQTVDWSQVEPTAKASRNQPGCARTPHP